MTTTILPQAQSLPADWRDFFALTKPRVMSLVDLHRPVRPAGGAGADPSGARLHRDPVHRHRRRRRGGAQHVVRGRSRRADEAHRRPADPRGPHGPQTARDFGVGLAVFSVLPHGRCDRLARRRDPRLSIFYYAVVYTIWLKPRTPQNIVIGGGAGAFPPLIGWVAATGDVTLMPVLLFAIIFLWTPPHFWALSLFVRTDYAKAGMPMLPVVPGRERPAARSCSTLLPCGGRGRALGDRRDRRHLRHRRGRAGLMFLALRVRVFANRATEPAGHEARKAACSLSRLSICSRCSRRWSRTAGCCA